LSDLVNDPKVCRTWHVEMMALEKDENPK
jgi:hypothetical protein